MQCEAILEFHKLDIRAIAAESSTGTWTTVGTDGLTRRGGFTFCVVVPQWGRVLWASSMVGRW